MNGLRERTTPMDEERFLAWAELQDDRYELLEGEAVMQAGATRDHERVAKRVFASLYRQVDETRFDVNKGDFGVRIRPGEGRGTVLYPDVVVDLQSSEGGEKATTTPIVIVEVLSNSTDLAYHIDKLSRYKARSSLRRYVVYDQARPLAYLWVKGDAGWPAEPLRIEGEGEIVPFAEVGAAVPMAEVYRK